MPPTLPRPDHRPPPPPGYRPGPAGRQPTGYYPGQAGQQPFGHQPASGVQLPPDYDLASGAPTPPGYHEPVGFELTPPMPVNPFARRRSKEPRNPLIQPRRSSGGWIGCVVVLVFTVAIAFNAVQALATTLLDLLR